MEAKLSDSRTKDIFPPDLRINISEVDFCVLGRALKLSVEVILNPIVLFFRRGVSTN